MRDNRLDQKNISIAPPRGFRLTFKALKEELLIFHLSVLKTEVYFKIKSGKDFTQPLSHCHFLMWGQYATSPPLLKESHCQIVALKLLYWTTLSLPVSFTRKMSLFPCKPAILTTLKNETRKNKTKEKTSR